MHTQLKAALGHDPAWWRFGSLGIWVHAAAGEVRVGVAGGEDPMAEGVEGPTPGEEPAETERFALPSAAELQWSVRTADRSFVVRPASALTILPGASVEVFVSTPLWVGLRHGPREEPFFERPTHRPNDTWFGPTPQAGELAYSSRSRARTRCDLLERRVSRSLTKLVIRNALASVWAIERLKVPVPHLALYQGSDDQIWTSGITFARDGEDEVELDVLPGPGAEAGDVTLLEPARLAEKPRLILGALGRLGFS